jgi:saccharopine dehydrogenase-like NADP-dependent oxidoreductase
MKITVLGGSGAMAKASVRHLVESKFVSEVLIADIEEGQAAKFAKELGSGKKVSTIHLDVSEHDRLVKAIRGSDAVLDGTPHHWSVAVAQGMIEAKVNGCCIGYRADTVHEILKLDSLAKAAGIAYLLSAGISPGTDTILVKYLADKMDLVSDVAIYGSSLRPLALSPGLLETFLTEVPEPKMVYENGKLKEVPPFGGREEIEYPEPFPPGKYPVYNAQHSEVVSVPLTIPSVKNVTIKMGWHRDYTEELKYWYDLGLFDREPIRVKGTEIVPRDVLVELLTRRPVEEGREKVSFVIWIKVTGKKHDREVTGSIFMPFMPMEGEKDVALARATGIPASIMSQRLGRGVEVTGIMPPEACIDPQEFIHELLEIPGFEVQERWD